MREAETKQEERPASMLEMELGRIRLRTFGRGPPTDKYNFCDPMDGKKLTSRTTRAAR